MRIASRGFHRACARSWRTTQQQSSSFLSKSSYSTKSGSGNGFPLTGVLGTSVLMLYGAASLYSNDPSKVAFADHYSFVPTPIELNVVSQERRQKNLLRTISMAEFKDMADVGRIVVTLRGKVYDVTDFTGHPGGYGRIQMVAGTDLEAYWRIYTQHNRGHVESVLQNFLIGEMSLEDGILIRDTTTFDNPHKNDPPASPELLTNTRHPYNAEARLSLLTESFVTPVGRHFVRNHNVVPEIDVNEYTLTITGAGLTETTFTFEDLKQFEKVEVTTVVQCNGNRREDFHFVDGKTPAYGPPHWVAGAISNSTWSGVRLRDLLRHAGMNIDDIALGKAAAPHEATNVELLGMDADETGNPYCCSFPFEKAIDPFGDVVIAYEMNGSPIPRSHGYPVRAIIPGYAGARNCKYLERVTITNKACATCENWKQYSVHSPDTPLEKLLAFDNNAEELEKDYPVMEMPVQSMITVPSAGDILAAAAVTAAVDGGRTHVHVKGVAWGGGGEGVHRVDVSLDGGSHFTRAELLDKPDTIKERRGGKWSWQFFEKDIPIPEDMLRRIKAGEKVSLELTSKAVNSSLNVQPERPEPYRNAHGCCVNHWYRVPVTIDPTVKEDQKAPDGEFGNKPSGGKFRRPFRNFDELPLHVQAERGLCLSAAADGCPMSSATAATTVTTVAADVCPYSHRQPASVEEPSPLANAIPIVVKEEEASPLPDMETVPTHVPTSYEYHPSFPSVTRPSLILK